MNLCRLCHGELQVVLDLGTVPPANRYRRASELTLPEPTFPLRFARCTACNHAQLADTVDPRVLFTDRPYLYASGTSRAWRTHCKQLAASLPAGKGALALDLGSNDGTMLGYLRTASYRAVGVEPSQQFADIGTVYHQFWNQDTARDVVYLEGHAHVITAMNVFAHVGDSEEFLRGCAHALADHGTLILEFPHLLPMLESGAFDAIYHEHVHYYHLRSLVPVAQRCGLVVVGVQPLAVHGGSLRVFLKPESCAAPVDASVRTLLDMEDRIDWLAFKEFAVRAQAWQDDWIGLLASYRDQGKRIVGYGASAKGNVLLTTCPVPEAVAAIVDDNPAKQGWYTPGQPIPIVPMAEMGDADLVILFAWNWAGEMEQALRKQGYRGEIAIPFPTLQVV